MREFVKHFYDLFERMERRRPFANKVSLDFVLLGSLASDHTTFWTIDTPNAHCLAHVHAHTHTRERARAPTCAWQ